MKKYITYTLLSLVMIMMASCDKEDVPMTSTVNVAGEWMVTIDVIDNDGTIMEDPYGMGPVMFITYNTNADNGKEIWLDDCHAFKPFGMVQSKITLPCDVKARTFGSEQPVLNYYQPDPDEPYYITVSEGKITVNGTKSPSGMPVDAIEFKLEFSDDPGTIHYIHGYRRTGFVADEG